MMIKKIKNIIKIKRPSATNRLISLGNLKRENLVSWTRFMEQSKRIWGMKASSTVLLYQTMKEKQRNRRHRRIGCCTFSIGYCARIDIVSRVLPSNDLMILFIFRSVYPQQVKRIHLIEKKKNIENFFFLKENIVCFLLYLIIKV